MDNVSGSLLSTDGSDPSVSSSITPFKVLSELNKFTNKITLPAVHRSSHTTSYSALTSIASEKEIKLVSYEESTQSFEEFNEEITNDMKKGTERLCEGLPLLSEDQDTVNEVIEEELQIVMYDEEKVVEDLVKVRFTTDGGETVVLMINIDVSMMKLKQRIADVFTTDIDTFRLTREGLECNNQTLLSEYITPHNDVVEFGIQSIEAKRILTPTEFSNYVPITKTIQVYIPQDVGNSKVVGVTLEFQCFMKEWLGGYRNPTNNLEYHHAQTQTMPRQRRDGSLPQYTSQTQTPRFPLKELEINTVKDKSVQNWRTNHYVTTEYDKIVSTDPNRFIHATPSLSWYGLIAIIILTKSYCKRFLLRYGKHLEEIKKQKELETESALRNQREDILLNSNRKLIIGGAFPISRDDFYVLYLAIGKWWEKESKQEKTEGAKMAARYELVLKEAKLLRGIETQRTSARKEVLLHQKLETLATCARPFVFRNHDGHMSSIDTVDTQQARELQEILSSYLDTTVTKGERLDILNTFINFLRTYNPNNEEEIIELLKRECDLLAIGIKNNQLKTLRARILQLLLHNILNPNVTPSFAHYKKPNLPRTYKKSHLCPYCGKVKLASEFYVHVKQRHFESCYSCEWMRNISLTRVDLTPFIRILEHVRRTEFKYCSKSSVAYVLQAHGMRYLTSHIWNCKSILSSTTNLNDLRFYRFINKEDWTPWNCILLTLEESKLHISVDNVYKFYSPRLLNIIRWRHMRARMHFLSLVLYDRYLSESKLWANCQDAGKFLHFSHINRFAGLNDFEHFA